MCDRPDLNSTGGGLGPLGQRAGDRHLVDRSRLQADRQPGEGRRLLLSSQWPPFAEASNSRAPQQPAACLKLCGLHSRIYTYLLQPLSGSSPSQQLQGLLSDACR
jgi:hypothetical protein